MLHDDRFEEAGPAPIMRPDIELAERFMGPTTRRFFHRWAGLFR